MLGVPYLMPKDSTEPPIILTHGYEAAVRARPGLKHKGQTKY